MTITTYRRIAQIAFILFIFLIPVLNILRYDSSTRELIVFGNTWSLGLRADFYTNDSIIASYHVALQFFLKAILPWLGILAIFPLLGTISGRLFCGWFCPEGTLFEYFDFLTLKIFGRRSIFKRSPNDPQIMAKNRLPYVILTLLSIIIIPPFGGVILTGYFVKPQTVWDQIINWHFSFGVKAGIIGVSIYLLISSLIVRHTLCKYVCSAGLMQMLFGWVSPVSLKVMVDQSRIRSCTDCRSCETVCFMNVKPRVSKKDINCVNCGECIEACNMELGRGILNFTFSGHSTAKADKKIGDFVVNYEVNDMKGGQL